jgi:hypothetical protein
MQKNGETEILLRHYDISLEKYNQILLNQNNCCKICKINILEVSRRFAVDHDHETNQIRGLLCVHCNSGLGHFKDKKELLQEAINYLEESKNSTLLINNVVKFKKIK